ncbi:hypothetical protein [Microbispora catharanthi]|uniref:Uncharacterized protein n=1 Tax=Microbispora catharanthi TaxID=1712871 RepID=A0A5N6BA61_9ACTN|nr:hypothetical protein [Microbispora catharanthi]KAB8177282.1 hypothetical protein FH610_037605 [Microbispora catharanthi]
MKAQVGTADLGFLVLLETGRADGAGELRIFCTAGDVDPLHHAGDLRGTAGHPCELCEAAAIDGASPWRIAWAIKVSMVHL